MKAGCTCRSKTGDPCLVAGIHTVSRHNGVLLLSNGVRIERMKMHRFAGNGPGRSFPAQVFWTLYPLRGGAQADLLPARRRTHGGRHDQENGNVSRFARGESYQLGCHEVDCSTVFRWTPSVIFGPVATEDAARAEIIAVSPYTPLTSVDSIPRSDAEVDMRADVEAASIVARAAAPAELKQDMLDRWLIDEVQVKLEDLHLDLLKESILAVRGLRA